MADRLSDTFNPFGLTDSATLQERRRLFRHQREAEAREGLSGMSRIGHDAGRQLGTAIGQIMGRAGIIKDKEGETALAVDQAAKDAQAAYDSIPAEQRATDPFGVGIQRRRELIKQLDAAGLSTQADTVRTQILSLSEQQSKFKKLNAETEREEIGVEQDRVELEATKAGAREKDEFTRLQNAHAMLDLTDPIQAARADQIMARLNKLTAITGTTEFDPSASDKVTVRGVEKSLFENQATLDGFMQSQEAFDPSFLTLGGKIKNFAFKAADIAGMDLPEEQKAELAKFTTFKQRTSMNLNAYIKAITGAQMSNPEAVRLKKDVPTQDDSPTEYKTKLENIVTKLTAVRARSLQAMGSVDDRQQFTKIMTTSLDEFMPQARELTEQGDPDGDFAAAEAALADLESLLNQGQ